MSLSGVLSDISFLIFYSVKNIHVCSILWLDLIGAKVTKKSIILRHRPEKLTGRRANLAGKNQTAPPVGELSEKKAEIPFVD